MTETNRRRILAPIDFSELSREALNVADRIAVQRDAELVVLHVHPIVQTAFLDMTYTEPPEKLSESINTLEAKTSEWASGLKTPASRIMQKVVIGGPVEEIAAESESAGMMVIATHGRTGLTHFLMGSVAERVVRLSKCAVLVVKKDQQAELPFN